MILAASPYFVAFTLVMAWIARRDKNLAVFAAPFLWVALELARARMPDIGFPWNLLGYSAAGNLALVQLISVTGIYGLSFLLAVYNALIVWLIRSSLPSPPQSLRQAPHQTPRQTLDRGQWRRPASVLGALTALILVVALIGPGFVPSAQPSRVAHLVQTDLPQSMEYPANWDVIHAPDMAELNSISIAAGQRDPGLVLWPEVPAPFSLREPDFARRVQEIARDSKSDFLVGVVDWNPQPDGRLAPYNSAAHARSRGQGRISV